MEVLNSWEKKGKREGKREGEVTTYLKILNDRLGQLSPLQSWLEQHK